MKRRFTGYHMTAILVGFFGVVVAVNFTMASFARSSFTGVVVENSYVASQNFNAWLDQAEAQDKLGWDVATSQDGDGRIRIVASGPGPRAELAVEARHPLDGESDRLLQFERQADGSFVSSEALPDGRWVLRIELKDGDAQWRREDHL